MANANPIKKKDPGKYPSFRIDKQHKDKVLSISTETSVDNAGWKLDITHTLRANGEKLYPDADPDITREQIGKLKDLAEKKMALCSNPTRIRDGGDLPGPNITYKLLFYVDDLLLETHDIEADEDSPSFYTKITFEVS
jgi:hypothetical protein